VAGATFDLSDLERLSTVLDALELDEKNRATLHAVFALAGMATAGSEDEVSGFALLSLMQMQSQEEALMRTFQQAASQAKGVVNDIATGAGGSPSAGGVPTPS
jgi:hypothetical protein